MSREQATRLAFGDEAESAGSGECVFVFGGRGSERVLTGIRLLNEGTSECEKLVQYAREGQIRDIEIDL